jgi:hypothetical protein
MRYHKATTSIPTREIPELPTPGKQTFAEEISLNMWNVKNDENFRR